MSFGEAVTAGAIGKKTVVAEAMEAVRQSVQQKAADELVGIECQFNPSFPKTFPRFVQHAIWRYCSQNGLDVCNGNRIDETRRCDNLDCRVRLMCDRVVLRNMPKR